MIAQVNIMKKMIEMEDMALSRMENLCIILTVSFLIYS